MRVLFTFIGGHGHLRPLLPVATAARAAGHTVAIAGSARQSGAIRAEGFEAIPTNAPPDPVPASAPTRDLTPLEPVDPARDEREFADNFAGRGARRHALALLDVVRDWAPDVVVRDEADFGSGIAAEHEHVPCAVLLVLAAGSLLRRDLVAGPLGELRHDYGLPEDPTLAMVDGDLVLSPFPASFRHPDFPLPATALSYRTHNTAELERKPDDVRRIYFTLGTTFNSCSGDLVERVLAGLHDFPGRVVATVGRDVDPAELGPQPDRIAVERYVDQATLLPTCDLVISHGGSGSVTGALAHGLPTLVLPLGADQSHNGERLTRLGAGLVLDATSARPDDVAKAVHTLLGDPAYRHAAMAIRTEIAGQPGPELAVAELEALVSG